MMPTWKKLAQELGDWLIVYEWAFGFIGAIALVCYVMWYGL